MTQQSRERAGRYGRDMTTGSIPRHIVLFSIPMLMGNAIHTAYQIVNAIWVGKGLGETSLAAVTETMFIIFLLMALAIGLTMGTGILVSQFAGAGNWGKVREVIQSSALLIFTLCIVLVAAGEVYSPWMMKALECPPNVYPLAVSYLRMILLCAPFMFAMFLSASILRGMGDSKTPLYFQVGSLLGTAVLDPVLMFGWLGFPKMGLNGTAVATAVTQGAGLIAMLIYLRGKRHIMTLGWRSFSVNRPMLWLIMKIGFPSSVQQSLVSLAGVFVVRFVNFYGQDAAAAFGATSRLDQVAFLPAMTFNVAIATMVGQNIGAGRIERVREIFKWGALLSGGITLVVSVCAVTFSVALMAMFLDEPAAIAVGAGYLRTVGTCYIFFALMLAATGVINGSGHTLITTAISFIGICCARIPLAYLFSTHMKRVEGIWYAIVISSALGMCLAIGCYASGLWKRPIVRKHLLSDDETEFAPSHEPAIVTE